MYLQKISIFIVSILCGACLPLIAAAATTPVSGTITSNTTWNPAGSPYVISTSVTVNSGVTLTIAPGTAVKFGSGALLLVNGTLSAAGASGNMVHFTDLRDDAVDGNDTNGDGTASSPAAGGWQSINVSEGGSAVFDYCSIRFGGGAASGSLYKYGGGSLTVSNSTVSDSKTYGINYVTGISTVGTISISDSAISGNGSDGINLSGTTGTINLSGNTISGNTGSGIFIDSGSFSLQNNTLVNNGTYGMRLMGGTLSSASGTSASGNTAGAVSMLANFLPMVSPALLSGNLVIDGGILSQNFTMSVGTPYVVVTTFEVGAAANLTTPAGTVVKFGTGAGINVSGALNSTGIAGNPVFFTDLRDDSAGGDTNGDGTTSAPAAGGWNGISVSGNASLSFSSIRYANTDVSKLGGGSLSINNCTISTAKGTGISISGSAAAHSVTNSIISENGTDGILLTGNSGTLTVTGNSITGNAGSGIFSDSGALGLQGNSITGNSGYALNLGGGTFSTPVTGNTFSGNTAGAFRLMAEHLLPLSAAATTEKIVIAGGTVTQTTTLNAATPYVVESIFTIGATTGILNVPAGTTMKFGPGAGIDVSGTLNANGIAGSMVYFTDLNSGVAGGWRGILVTGAGNASLTFSTVSFGSDNIKSDGSGSITISNSVVNNASASGIQLVLSSASLSVINSTVSYNGADGIQLSNSNGAISITGNKISYNSGKGVYTEGAGTNPAVRNNIIAKNAVGVYASSGALPVIGGSDINANSIFQNSAYGVQNAGTATVNATYNWWGSSTGPRHATNPAGTGNAVSNLVTFIPYRTTQTFAEAVATFTPELYDFKRVRVGVSSAPQNITVTNVGSQALAFGMLTLGGLNPTEFQITADNCSNASIAPAASCTITVTFTPTDKLTFSAQIEVPAGGTSILPLYSVALTGTGYTPVALPFRDDFTANYSPDWTNIRPVAPLPTVVAGSLQINSALSPLFDPSSPNGATYNVFTLAIPPALSKLMVTAKMNLPAAYLDNFPQGGIILFPEKNSQPDLSTYIRTQYRGLTNPSTRGFQTTVDVNGSLNTYNGATALVDTVWLRLIRRGTAYQSLYSTDGITFTPWQTDSLQQDAAYAGLFAFREANSRATTSVGFDFFEVVALPTISAPASVAFGNVPNGSTALQNVTISNTGSGPLSLSSLNISGTNAALFSADLGSCNLPVPAGGACSLSLSLNASVMGPVSATLGIGSNDIDTPTLSIPLSGTVATPITLSIGFLGTGGGTVRYLNQNTVCNSNCTVSAATGGTISFQATPAEYSLFTIWGGSCSGNGACSFTAPGSTGGVTATFDRDSAHSVKINPASYYSTILGAYGNAPLTGTTTIKTWSTNYDEPLPLVFDLDKNIFLDGGYDGTFSTNNGGMTTVRGKMTVITGATGGRVAIRNITLKPLP